MALHTSMAEALRLTRAGKLMEATVLLQTALGSGRPAAATAAAQESDTVIRLVPERIALASPPATNTQSSQEAPRRAGDTGVKSRFDERTFRSSQGSMTYWLYRPAKSSANPPLVVMLHGCTQSPQDFARGTGMNLLADELGFLVAYPQQSAAANAQKCWNWFRRGDQQRDRGEPAQLAGITREIIAKWNVDSDRVYIAGLSAGGAAAAIMAAQYPDIYAAVGVHSGLACGAARDLPSALLAMRRGGGAPASTHAGQYFVPLITFHGDRDATVNAVNSDQLVAAATSMVGKVVDLRVEKGRSTSGRAYTREQSVDDEGTVLIEQWTIEGAGHAWSGGSLAGSYTDPSGPEASREMMRFFLGKRHA